MTRVGALMLAVALAGCSHTGGVAPAIPAATGDPLHDAAALLTAAESAANAAERRPLIERLNAMNVALQDGASDDPLAGWRSEYRADGSTPFRGRTLGPAYRRARLAAGETLQIEQIFYAGERAEIAAEASEGGNIAIKISDPRQEPVCEKNLSPSANCDWLPIFTERFSIELQNSGDTPASIYIVFK